MENHPSSPPNLSSRPPEYFFSMYRGEDHDHHQHQHHDDEVSASGPINPAAVRLLTSIDGDDSPMPEPCVAYGGCEDAADPFESDRVPPLALVPAPLSIRKVTSSSTMCDDEDDGDNNGGNCAVQRPETADDYSPLPRKCCGSSSSSPAFTRSVRKSRFQEHCPALRQDQKGAASATPANPPLTPIIRHKWPAVNVHSLIKPINGLPVQPRTPHQDSIAPPISAAFPVIELPNLPPGPSSRKSNLLQEGRGLLFPLKDKSVTLNPVNPSKEPAKRDLSNRESSTRTSHPRSCQPPTLSSNSRHSSVLDPPSMPAAADDYYSGRDSGSPTRTWSPSHISSYHISDYTRPPPSGVQYEPSDLNGSPRPGTPSSRYGGSPRRPLPQAPLFPIGGNHGNSQSGDEATVNIPLHDHDDPFGPESDLSQARPERESYLSNGSQETLSEMPGHHIDENGHVYDVPQSRSPAKFEHYGPAPEGKQERRGVRAPQMSRKEVQLINGELVLECKIPTILYSFLPRRDEIEFTHMRYTAVTCDPDDFVDRGYKLRQNIGRTARETELFICITMYNENEIHFTRTMHAVMKNISHFCGRNKSRTWGESGWQKIVVCIVSDGRERIHLRTLDALAAMGVYQHGIAKNYVNSKAVQAHVYEYTTQVSLDSDLKFKGAEKGIVPCQMIFCLKEKNMKKLNSHRWCFNAFAKALNPNVCILLDVGTRPGGNSLYHLWKAFDSDSNVAGACGEIKAMKGRMGANLLNPLVASQNFEYKMSNILDKPLESVFGYITVLPGALSAYRYHALQNDDTGHGPLSQYFKGETLQGQHADVFTANMYLAEDRILCWELVGKRNESWVLKYVKGCTGETDVPGKFLQIPQPVPPLMPFFLKKKRLAWRYDGTPEA